MTDNTIDVGTFMSLHTGDTLKEITGRPLPEIGAEFMLLVRCWLNGGSLPSDPERLRRLAGADKDEWPAIWAQLSPLWTTSEDGQSVVHPGIAVQVGRARAAKLKAIERGRAGGSAPHPSQRDKPRTSREQVDLKSRTSRDGAEPEIEMEPSLLTPNSEPPDLPPKRDLLNNDDLATKPHCSTGGPAEPGVGGDVPVLQLVPGQAEPEAKKGKARKTGQAYSETFVRFWAAWPKKVSKEAAWQAWRKLEKGGPLPLDAILVALEWQQKTHKWTKDDGEYIPHPDKYLRQRLWEDDLAGYSKPGNGVKPGRDPRVGWFPAEACEHPEKTGPIDLAAVPRGRS